MMVTTVGLGVASTFLGYTAVVLSVAQQLTEDWYKMMLYSYLNRVGVNLGVEDNWVN